MNLDTVYQIIEDYNQPAFESCRDALYDILDYKVLQKEEIRQVDLKEKLAVFLSSANMVDKLEKLFVNCTEPLITFHIETAHGNERIKKYDLLRKKYADLLKEDNNTLPTLENYVLIYLAHFRSHMKLNSTYTDCRIGIQDADYYLHKDDISVLKYIRTCCHITKQDNKKKLIGKQQVVKTQKIKFEERLLIYIIGVLVFYRILQFEGEI